MTGISSGISSLRARDRLLSALASGKMTDIELVGDGDGVPVPASRFLLAATSPALEAMLSKVPQSRKTNNPEDTKNDVPRLTLEGYNSDVLKAVLEFGCTDTLQILKQQQKDSSNIVKTTRDTILLAQFAEQFDIPVLYDMAVTHACSKLEEYPTMACVAFELLSTTKDKSLSSTVRSQAIRILVEQPNVALSVDEDYGGGLAALSPEQLETIVKRYYKWQDGEFRLIQLLLDYQDVHPDSSMARLACRKIASGIDLTTIDPRDLRDTVLPSGLYEEQDVWNAFMNQALRASREGVLSGLSGSASSSMSPSHPTSPHHSSRVNKMDAILSSSSSQNKMRNLSSQRSIHAPESGKEYVLVTGAGVDQVNGIYYLDDENDCLYNSSGRNTPDGSNSRYLLYLSREDGYFKFSKEDGDEFWKEGSSKKILFYQARKEDDISMLQWELGKDGHGPVPVCTYYPR